MAAQLVPKANGKGQYGEGGAGNTGGGGGGCEFVEDGEVTCPEWNVVEEGVMQEKDNGWESEIALNGVSRSDGKVGGGTFGRTTVKRLALGDSFLRTPIGRFSVT